MKIKMCAFIPSSLGSSLRMCDLPKGLSNQTAFDSQVRTIQGNWLKEPYPSTVFCGTDNREFGNIQGSSRLAAYNEKAIDLALTGRFSKVFGRRSPLFTKLCSDSSRAFVQTSHHSLSVWEMNTYPRIPYEGGRFPVFEKRPSYGYIHLQSKKRGEAEQNWDLITDINTDYSKIEVKTSAGYPYLEPFSPNIDFNFTINVHRTSDNYQVEIIGCHNEFPCYELYINGLSVYQYKTKWQGPNPVNLNRNFSFTVRKQFLK